MLSSTVPEATSWLASARISCFGLLRALPLMAGMVQKEHFLLQPSLMRRYAQCGGVMRRRVRSSQGILRVAVTADTGLSDVKAD